MLANVETLGLPFRSPLAKNPTALAHHSIRSHILHNISTEKHRLGISNISRTVEWCFAEKHMDFEGACLQ